MLQGVYFFIFEGLMSRTNQDEQTPVVNGLWEPIIYPYVA
jgi:hypothetical protein